MTGGGGRERERGKFRRDRGEIMIGGGGRERERDR
jgi:hypothetical protein